MEHPIECDSMALLHTIIAASSYSNGEDTERRRCIDCMSLLRYALGCCISSSRILRPPSHFFSLANSLCLTPARSLIAELQMVGIAPHK